MLGFTIQLFFFCLFDLFFWRILLTIFKRTLLALVTVLPLAFTSAVKAQDIVDTAIAAGQFETLVAAVQAAGLVDTLKGEGPFTVFAPNDAAFAALPAGTVENLLKPENKDMLVAVLTYHVIPGKVMAADIAGMKMDVATVQGSTLAIDATNGVMVDNATVIAADIETSNGVIHIIDTVVLPK
ncbi:MAG: putative surface protein with fasciclin (FAS1) repeats [Pseudohongiellaceae bacterium]